MAIEAHHPSNHLFGNCGEEPTGDHGFFEPPSTVIFPEEVGNLNPRKRGREESILNPLAAGVAPVTNCNVGDFSFLQPNSIASPMFVNVNWPQAKSVGPLSSTGLQLGFGVQQQTFQTAPSSVPAGISDELVLHLQQFQKEIDEYVREQGEILRRSITGKWQSHTRTLIRATVSTAQRRLMAKEAERQLAVRRVAELEQRIIQLQDETLSWRTKALVAQSQFSSLQIQLQHAAEVAAVARERQGESCDPALADDAASAACVDSPLPSASFGSCRACCKKESTAVVLPCRHLCLCADCSDSDSALLCPVCGFLGTGILPIAFT